MVITIYEIRSELLKLYIHGTPNLIILAPETLSEKISNYRFVKNINGLQFRRKKN